MDENKKALIKDTLSSIDECIPQGNQLFIPVTPFIGHLKQTGIMEPIISGHA